jgi:NADH:ubiquinone oxidoreductase subunit D
MDSRAIADELTPAALEIVTAHKAQWLAELRGIDRLGLRLAWGIILRWVPRLVTVSVELFAFKFEKMTIGEIVEALRGVRHTAAYVRPGPSSRE